MKHIICIVTFLFFSKNVFPQNIAELNANNKSLTYDQAIDFYKKLALTNKNCQLFETGLTDIGRPLHLFVISSDKTFDAQQAKSKNKAVVLINNGIHPGEPDGINASARLAEKYLSGKIKIPENVVICIVPVFNIDGALNSRCCTRANQNGPDEQGFRGNAQNLDLNRDFIKCDSENAKSLIQIFREWDPDVFIDTHVSNGSDYRYTMTLISTQHNKLGGEVGNFLKNEMTPAIFTQMKNAGFEMSPYVNTTKYDESPEGGIYGFLESPRFASGYAALFNCLSFVPETHMLKPFPKRVDATLKLLEIFINYTSANAQKIIEVRKASKAEVISKKTFPIDWTVDTTKFENINFKGYEAVYKTSKVTGQQQLTYDREKPFDKPVKFFDEYYASTSVTKPSYYIVPQAWKNVISRMMLNQIKMKRLPADTIITVETYVIEDLKTGTNPYEGHYVHNNVKFKSEVKNVQYRKGDYRIDCNQEGNRFIIETLEPNAPDSWFTWGFFDAILQQKEWFSAYVFDQMAEKILEQNPKLKSEFESKKNTDPEFAKDSFSQLYFIYKNSEWFEDYRRYPVGRKL